jgi:hypothetical protein
MIATSGRHFVTKPVPLKLSAALLLCCSVAIVYRLEASMSRGDCAMIFEQQDTQLRIVSETVCATSWNNADILRLLSPMQISVA